MSIVKHHSVGVIVYFENEKFEREYLLLRYPEGHFDFVKGHIDDVDSDAKATALRELREETAIKNILLQEGFFESMYYSYSREGYKHEKQVDYFLGKVSSKEVLLSHEHTDFQWCTYNSAIKVLTFENAKNLLVKAESFLGSE
jgi:8-oxo-dGTP pyrophosphatase MutT (NUDIX family)